MPGLSDIRARETGDLKDDRRWVHARPSTVLPGTVCIQRGLGTGVPELWAHISGTGVGVPFAHFLQTPLGQQCRRGGSLWRLEVLGVFISPSLPVLQVGWCPCRWHGEASLGIHHLPRTRGRAGMPPSVPPTRPRGWWAQHCSPDTCSVLPQANQELGGRCRGGTGWRLDAGPSRQAGGDIYFYRS